MPSGRNESYAANFNRVDWGELYDRHDGYLLFEDLKEQWERTIKPDYVLIDSRTGHTDTSGICTRQLPDSVVVFFFPNEQNLRGLTEVVGDIRAEVEEPRKKHVELHFVMSNVPDLDDEDRILESKIEAFRDQLGFRREPMIVHRYDSLSLLNQVVFSKDRPRSRLAQEYGEIVREISTRNWNDRDGALKYISRAGRSGRWMEDDSILTRRRMLRNIQKAHSDDGDVLFRLAELREADGQPESAALLVNQAIEAGYDQPDAYLKRSRIRADNNDTDGASEDAWRVLASDQADPPMAREAIRRLTRLEACIPKEITGSTAVTSLEVDDKLWLSDTFDHFLEDVPIAVALCEQILDAGDLPAGWRARAESSLGLSYMALGRCSDARRMFRSEGQGIDDLDIAEAFNYGMAVWGTKGAVETEAFERVVALDRADGQQDESPNYLQCMAIACWATGDGGAAVDYVDRAQQAVSGIRGGTEFSCWRYLEVGATSFEEDLGEIRALIEEGGPRMPKFVTGTSNGASAA